MAADKMLKTRPVRKSSPTPLVLLPEEPRQDTSAEAWRHLCWRMQAAHYRVHLEKLVRRGACLADLTEVV